MNKIGTDCEDHPIVPLPGQRLSVKVNRHTTTSGELWGWIEGTDRNTVWGNDSRFNQAAAEELCNRYNESLST